MLPGGRVLPEYMSTHQDRWQLGSRDVMMCGSAAIRRCADHVVQEHWYDDSTGLHYFYRTAGVLRWTIRSTAREKTTRDRAKTCMHSLHEEMVESSWHVKAWGTPRWHALSAATSRGRREDISTITRCLRD